MYLNRFTILASPNNSLLLEKLKQFNLIYSEIEEELFKVMPKKINVGGYAFVSIKLQNDKNKGDWVKEYGQIADCNLHTYQFDIEDFLAKEKVDQRNEVLDIYEKGLKVLVANLDVDEIPIIEAINHIRERNIETNKRSSTKR